MKNIETKSYKNRLVFLIRRLIFSYDNNGNYHISNYYYYFSIFHLIHIFIHIDI